MPYLFAELSNPLKTRFLVYGMGIAGAADCVSAQCESSSPIHF
jgi:hypothetical protein